MPTRVAILILSSLTLIGCAKPLELVLSKEKPLKLEIFENGSPKQKCTIAPGSGQFAQLEALLAANREDWEPTPVTFVPSVLITSSDFSINFLQGNAVVNYARGQFTHPMAKSTYAFLRCGNGT